MPFPSCHGFQCPFQPLTRANRTLVPGGLIHRGQANWTSLIEAGVVIGDFKTEHNQRHRHSALGYRTPAEYAAACTCTHHPVACGID